MAETRISPAIQQALQELQRYLSDQVPPLMVADSIEELLVVPPGVVASTIEGWVATQYRGGADSASLSDYLFHAMKKIHMMSALKLIQGERMTKYVEVLGQIVTEMIPAEERDSFRTTLKGLEQADADASTTVNLLRAGGGGPGGGAGGGAGTSRAKTQAPAASINDHLAQGLKKFSMLLQRLTPGMLMGTASGGSGAAGAGSAVAGSVGAKGAAQSELMTQILATAALNSRSGADLSEYMQRLSQAGIQAQTEQVFRALGQSLPGWVLPASAETAGPSPVATSRPAEAMRRLVSMAESPTEGVKRFTEMVHAAIEQFNDGQLSKAAAMFEVAERLITDKKVDLENAKLVRDRLHEKLSAEQLRTFAEKPEKHASLRRVLNFFPEMTVPGLMEHLDGEEKRDKRKMILALLEAHGQAARIAAMEKLSSCLAAGKHDEGGFYTRNLIFLMRRIARPGDDPPDQEVLLLSHHIKWGNSLIVIKEAIGALGQIRHVSAEQTLVARLKDYESLLLESEVTESEDEEIKVLLDRMASSLARMGTPNAWRTVVNHALQKQPRLGNTMARLDDLSGQDLTGDKELVEHLVTTLRGELPKKVLGFVMQKKNESVGHLIQAVSGTHSASVRQVLTEIVDKYADQEFGKAASKALSGFAAPARPAEAAPAMSLSGDLELFGLPTLLQTVADARMTGLLALTDRQGQPIANVGFDTGSICACTAGNLAGVDAVYQIFVRPNPGSFLFKSCTAPAADAGQAAAEPILVLPTMLEAMRRHDEFQQAKALVPDDASFKGTGVKPTGPADGEEEPAVLRAVWGHASMGATPTAVEASVPVDSYRIRRLYMHWIEQGSLAAK